MYASVSLCWCCVFSLFISAAIASNSRFIYLLSLLLLLLLLLVHFYRHPVAYFIYIVFWFMPLVVVGAVRLNFDIDTTTATVCHNCSGTLLQNQSNTTRENRTKKARDLSIPELMYVCTVKNTQSFMRTKNKILITGLPSPILFCSFEHTRTQLKGQACRLSARSTTRLYTWMVLELWRNRNSQKSVVISNPAQSFWQ